MHPTKHLPTLFFTVFLAAFSAPSFAADEPSSSAKPTRLRLFGQNAVLVKFYPNSACADGDSVSVSGGLGDAFSSFMGTAKNQSIGMPATPNTVNQSARDGILSKAYFREYEIAPGQPLTIVMGFRESRAAAPVVGAGPTTATVYCRTIATTFVPERGRDYEAALDIYSSEGVCVQTINEVRNGPAGVTLVAVPSRPADSCS